MNNGSYLGVAVSTDKEPYETIKLNQVDDMGGYEALSRSGWIAFVQKYFFAALLGTCLLYTSPSPRDATLSRMPSSA